MAALGTVVLAATGGAVAGWRYAPDSTSSSLVRVATRMPTGAPVYVTPECTLTPPVNTLKNADGSAPDHIGGRGGPIPPGFTPVRAVRCGEFGDGMSTTQTQAEIQDPQALSALTAAYRSTTDLEYRGPVMACAAYADLDPAVALVDAHGTAIWPGPPRDSCDHVVAAVEKIVEKGPWAVTRSVTTH